MKIGKKLTGLLLVLLAASTFAIGPVSAKRPSTGVQGLQVAITAIEVLDLDGDGESDDVILSGDVGVLTSQSGSYQITLTLDLKYLGTNQDNPIEKKTKLDTTIRKTITVYCEADQWTESGYSFEIPDKLGWYRGQVTASCEGITAESIAVEFDPPGGSTGPVFF